MCFTIDYVDRLSAKNRKIIILWIMYFQKFIYDAIVITRPRQDAIRSAVIFDNYLAPLALRTQFVSLIVISIVIYHQWAIILTSFLWTRRKHIIYRIIFFSFFQNRFSGTQNPASRSSLRNSEFSFRDKFSFPPCRRVAIYYTSRLARLSIDRLAWDAVFYADSTLAVRRGLRGRRRADEDARCRVGPGRFPRCTITTTRRGGVGVAQLSPNGSHVVVDTIGIAPSLAPKFVNVPRACSRNSRYRI